jgi:uncharacterized iron-regulated protein
MRVNLRWFVLCLLLTFAACGTVARSSPVAPQDGDDCVPVGRWIVPATRVALTTAELVDSLAEVRVVLLGESHERDEHHRWQLQTIAALQARHPMLVLGFEMFPRSSQAALDEWRDGRLGEAEFLEASRWAEVWGMPPGLYLPLFHFARMNRVPLVGLNVDRDLVARVAKEGWARIPEEDRAGVSTPAPASPAYREWLAEVYRQHAKEGGAASDGLESFIDAQLVRDRAFAAAIRDALLAQPDALVIGVMGTGHLEHGWGVPHQLASLGVEDVAVLLPWEKSSSCDDLSADVAAAVFGVDSLPEPARRPRLGVMIGEAKPGVSVVEVMAGSVAESAGIRVGDVIIEAAGQRLEGVTDLQRIVGHDPADKPLALRVRRDGKTMEIEANLSGSP